MSNKYRGPVDYENPILEITTITPVTADASGIRQELASKNKKNNCVYINTH